MEEKNYYIHYNKFSTVFLVMLSKDNLQKEKLNAIITILKERGAYNG